MIQLPYANLQSTLQKYAWADMKKGVLLEPKLMTTYFSKGRTSKH